MWSFNNPHTFSWREVNWYFHQNKALSRSWSIFKNAESAKRKNRNTDTNHMMWELLMILTRFPEKGLPQIFLKMKRSQDLGPTWKNEKQKYWCQPYDVGSFNDPHTIGTIKIKFYRGILFCNNLAGAAEWKRKRNGFFPGVIALYVIFTGVGNINPEFTGLRTLG